MIRAVAALSGFFADDGAVPHVQADAGDEGADVIQVRARRSVRIVVGHTGRQLHDHAVLADAPPSPAGSAAYACHPCRSSRRRSCPASDRAGPGGYAANPPVRSWKAFSTPIPRAPLLHDVALGSTTTYSLLVRSIIYRPRRWSQRPSRSHFTCLFESVLIRVNPCPRKKTGVHPCLKPGASSQLGSHTRQSPAWWRPARRSGRESRCREPRS